MPELKPVHPRRERKVRILGAACGFGAPDTRCSAGPDALLAAGLEQHLERRPGLDGTVMVRPDSSPDLALPEMAADFCTRLAEESHAAVTDGALPLVLGGDHSCAVGTWSGIGRALDGRLGLLWIDAHMDSHTPQTSPSGKLHGMPLAALLGHGDSTLTGCDAAGQKVYARDVCIVGTRSYEPEEALLLARLGVRVFGIEEVRQRGLDAVLREALATVQEGTAGFGISIDVDAIDPDEAPGVSTPVPGGLQFAELSSALRHLGEHPLLAGIEITEYNPANDRESQTARMILELVDSLFAARTSATASPSIETERRYAARNYEPLPVVLVRGQGVYLWDENGRRYLDMMSAYSAVSHGHSHPRLVRVLSRQARTLAVTSRAYYNDRLPQLLRRLCEITGMDLAVPVNTGLEAVETALKVARKWAYKVKGVAADSAEIIACAGNFHGRSTTIVGMSSEPQYRDGFGPFAPGFKLVPYGDAAALERAITPNTAAFIVEPVQGEAGIILPPPGYLPACERICRDNNVLLIADEVQTGFGRTGKLFACEHEGIKPDGMVLGKALGGGLLPVSAFVGRREMMGVLNPGDHGSTFGGNPLAAAVALEAIEIALEEGFADRSESLGRHLIEGLRAIRSPLIRDVRGRGLFIGVDIDPAHASAREVCEQLLRRGVLSKDTHQTVVRFAPALVIQRSQIDSGLREIRAAFTDLDAALRKAA